LKEELGKNKKRKLEPLREKSKSWTLEAAVIAGEEKTLDPPMTPALTHRLIK